MFKCTCMCTHAVERREYAIRAAIPATAARNDGSNASYVVCND